jgi:hypothetical protein
MSKVGSLFHYVMAPPPKKKASQCHVKTDCEATSEVKFVDRRKLIRGLAVGHEPTGYCLIFEDGTDRLSQDVGY